MKIKRINELCGELYKSSGDKSYVQNYIVIDPQYGDVPNKIRTLILNLGSGQRTYRKYYPGDGFFSPISQHKDPSKAIFYDDSDRNKEDAYAYEIGSDEISDWLFSEGFGPKDQILFLIWW